MALQRLPFWCWTLTVFSLSTPSFLCPPLIDCDLLTLVLVHDDVSDTHSQLWMKKLLIYAHNRDGRHIDLKTIQLPRENLDYQWIERHLGELTRNCATGFIISSRLPAADQFAEVLRINASNGHWPVIRVDRHACPPERPVDCLERALHQLIDLCSQIPLSTRLVSDASFVGRRFSNRLLDIKQGVVEKPARANPLNGRILKLVTLERPPFVITRRDDSGNVVSYGGISFEIIHALRDIYNFTYTVQYPVDNAFGTELSDGSWTGMIGLLIADQVDAGIAPFSVTSARSRVIDFTVAYYEEPTAILIPPPAEDIRLWACLKPFETSVWLTLLLVATCIPIILWAQLRLLWNIKKPASISSEPRPNMFEQFIFVFAVITTQSVRSVPPLGFGPRLLATVWSLSAVVFVYVYVGTLVSFLSVPKLKPIIYRLEDLPNSKLKWSVTAGTALESLFKNSAKGIYRSIGDGFRRWPESLVNSNLEGVQRVINSSYSFIKERSYLDYVMEKDFQESGLCRLSVAKEQFFKVNFALATSKGSHLAPLFDTKILRMQEAGLTDYWTRKYRPAPNNCNDLSHSGASLERSLNLLDLQSAFLILAIGLSLASLAFVCENLIHYIRKWILVK